MKAMGRQNDFKMTLTDLEKPSLDITTLNLEANGIEKSVVNVSFCKWGQHPANWCKTPMSDVDFNPGEGAFDLIIGSDIIFF